MVAAAVTAGTGISAGIAFFVGATALAAFWSYYSRNELILRVAGNVARQDELTIFEDTLKKDPSFVLQAYQWQETLAKYSCWDCCLYDAVKRSVRLEVAIRRVIEEDGRLPPWGADLLQNDLPPREGRITLRKRAEATQRKTLTHQHFRALPLAVELATVIIDEIEDELWAHHSKHINTINPPRIDTTVPTHNATNYGGPGHASTPRGGDEWPPTRVRVRRESYCNEWDALSGDRASELADDCIPSVTTGSSLNRPLTPSTSDAAKSGSGRRPSLRQRVFTPAKSRLGVKNPAEGDLPSGLAFDRTLDERMAVHARLLKNTAMEELLNMRQPTNSELDEQRRKFEIPLIGGEQQFPAEHQPNPPLAYVALANLRINGQSRALPTEENIENLRPVTIEIRRQKAIQQQAVERRLNELEAKQAKTFGGTIKRLCCCGVLCCCCGCCRRKLDPSPRENQQEKKKEGNLMSRMGCCVRQPVVKNDSKAVAPEGGNGQVGHIEMATRNKSETKPAEVQPTNTAGPSSQQPRIRDPNQQASARGKSSAATSLPDRSRQPLPGSLSATAGSKTRPPTSYDAAGPASGGHGLERPSRTEQPTLAPKQKASRKSSDGHESGRPEDVNKCARRASPHQSSRGPAEHRRADKEQESLRRKRDRDAASGSITRHNQSQAHRQQQPSGLALTGLHNFGTTCYMNATLQCLSGAIPLSTFFLSRDRCEKFCRNYRDGEQNLLLFDYTAVIRTLWRQNGGYMEPTGFRETCGLIQPDWLDCVQQDAMEFLDFILQSLHQELRQNIWVGLPPPLASDEERHREALPLTYAAAQEWQRVQKYYKSLIFSLFGGQHASRLRCSNCEHTVTTFEVIFDIRTEIPRFDQVTDQVININDCLDAYFQEETIDFTCPGCKVRCDGTKRLSLTKAPEILVIQFKRFEYDPAGFIDKIEAKVEVPLDHLDMSQYGDIEESDHRPIIYEAFALMKHDGDFEAGHYTSLVRSPETKNWFEFNDEKVTPLAMENTDTVASRRTYILFYQRRR